MLTNADITVLVVDDEGSLRESLAMILEMEEFNVLSAADGAEAIETLKKNKVHFVLSDVRMPNVDGVQLLEKIRELDPTIPIVVLMTGFSEHTKDEIIAKGALDVIFKPFDMDKIAEFIKDAVNRVYTN